MENRCLFALGLLLFLGRPISAKEGDAPIGKRVYIIEKGAANGPVVIRHEEKAKSLIKDKKVVYFRDPNIASPPQLSLEEEKGRLAAEELKASKKSRVKLAPLHVKGSIRHPRVMFEVRRIPVVQSFEEMPKDFVGELYKNDPDP